MGRLEYIISSLFWFKPTEFRLSLGRPKKTVLFLTFIIIFSEIKKYKGFGENYGKQGFTRQLA